jgi:signal transduction histidine kinase
VIAYDLLFLAAAGALAVLGALYFDRYRRSLFAGAAELREANRRIEEASRARTELLSGLSHDMRTPLAVLLGYAQIVGESEALDASLRAPVRSIQREARELQHLIDGVLALARLESGQLPLHTSAFRLAEALRPLRETAEDLLRGRPVALRWEVPEDLVVHSDAEKVREIARNLLTNAVKFTESGEIRLEARRASGGFCVTVSDTGAGIAPEKLDLIFERFQRLEADRAEDRQWAGLGFGLYLVRWLVRFLGGTIAVQSRPGEGSRFEVWLPGAPPA